MLLPGRITFQLAIRTAVGARHSVQESRDIIGLARMRERRLFLLGRSFTFDHSGTAATYGRDRQQQRSGRSPAKRRLLHSLSTVVSERELGGVAGARVLA